MHNSDYFDTTSFNEHVVTRSRQAILLPLPIYQSDKREKLSKKNFNLICVTTRAYVGELASTGWIFTLNEFISEAKLRGNCFFFCLSSVLNIWCEASTPFYRNTSKSLPLYQYWYVQHKLRRKKEEDFLEIFANTEFSIAQYSIRYKSVISTSSRLTLVNAEVMKGNETAMAAS